ncbi:MFS transporter [Chloroflexota bacterium]
MFYGWYIVTASALIMSYNSFLFIYGFTSFINPIINTFGWSYTQVSLAITVRSITSGTLNPFLGALVDRWPVRRLLIFGSIVLSLGLFSLSRVTDLVMFYIGFIIMGIGGTLATQLVPQTSVARWFRKNLGKANGIMGVSVALGGMAIPLLVLAIDTYGWQYIFLFAGIGTLVLIIPLSFVFRNRPEEYGLAPDGVKPTEMNDTDNSRDSFPGINVKEALKTRTFWIIGIGALAQVGSNVATIIHMMPHFVNVGMGRSSASLIVMLLALIGIVTRFPIGWLMDITSRRNIIALCIGFSSISYLLLSFIKADSLFLLIFVFAAAFGIGSAGIWLRPALLREYFGTKSFGAITGIITIFTLLGTSIFPVSTGWVFDVIGKYNSAFLSLGILSMIAALLTLLIPQLPKSHN